MSIQEKKEKELHIRLSNQQYFVLQNLAQETGLNVSSYTRLIIDRFIKGVGNSVNSESVFNHKL